MFLSNYLNNFYQILPLKTETKPIAYQKFVFTHFLQILVICDVILIKYDLH